MADDPLDWSREGRSLAEWLPLLVHASPRTRRAAENAVSAMAWGVDVADERAFSNGPADRAAHDRAFAAAVSDAILASGDDGRPLLERIVATIRLDRVQQWQRTQLEDQLLDLSIESRGDSPDAQALAAEIQMMGAADAGRQPNSHGPHTLHVVLRAAGEALLRHADLARAGLDDADVAGDVLTAIESLGPRGLAFAPDLLARLGPAARGRKDADVDAIRDALVAVAARDAEMVRRLITDARPPPDGDPAALAALEALARICPDARTLVDDLLPSAGADDWAAARRLRLLADIDASRRDVFDRVLALARPRPPLIRTEAHGEFAGRSYDEVPYIRGQAIDGLGQFRAFADGAVPVLVDALSTFEEYDPDWNYELGEHGRVIDALERLGPAAAGAVPAVIGFLRNADGDVDWRIVRFLGHLGPAAADALPALRALRDEFGPDDLEPGESPNELTEPLSWALARIDPAR